MEFSTSNKRGKYNKSKNIEMQVYNKMFCTSTQLTAPSHWVRFDQYNGFTPFSGNTCDSQLYCVEIFDILGLFFMKQ